MIGELFVDLIEFSEQEFDTSVILGFWDGLDVRLMIFDLSRESWWLKGTVS